MKKIQYTLLSLMLCMAMVSCDDFIDEKPQGVIDSELAENEPDKMVTAAYAMLGDCWYSYPFNLWPYGDLASDDCLKGGSGTTDTGYHPMEIWTTMTATQGEFDELWYRLYCAISRCNRALASLENYGEKQLGHDLAQRRRAEVLTLRAHFYFKLVTMFRQVPWIGLDEYRHNAQEQTRNDAFTYDQLMHKVIDDFHTAYTLLPTEQNDGGRVDRETAAAYLAKCYLTLAWGDGYEATNGPDHINRAYMDSVLVYTAWVSHSQYGLLEDYGDIFLPEYKNSKESVYAVQASDYRDDHTVFGRANWSNTLNGAWGIWSCGWDFHKPSQNLVNAFKTRQGLPLFDEAEQKADYPVCHQPNTQKWDPRLFHTVGMPTFPYKYEEDLIQTTANSRTPNTYGYYTSLKDVPQRSAGESYNGSWQAFAMNDYVFRFADVLLMRAEAMIETGDLMGARQIINSIRQRAMNSVDKHIAYAKDQCEIALYPESYFQDVASARQCLRWERRLELGMEGSRYFDLRRWGIASKTLNAYFQTEQNDVYEGQTYAQYLRDAHYTPGKNEFYPVPYNQLYYVPGLYKQNKGY